MTLVALAGCTTGYEFVRPGITGSGGYYTSDGPYQGRDYYQGYAVRTYAPVINRFGHYGGGLYPGTFGYVPSYGYGFRNHGYGAPFSLYLGISNGWSFPHHRRSGYATRFPAWRCSGPGCRSLHVQGRHDIRYDRDHPPPPVRPTRHERMPAPAMAGTSHRTGGFARAPRRISGSRLTGTPAPDARVHARRSQRPVVTPRRVIPHAIPARQPASFGNLRHPRPQPRTRQPVRSRIAPVPARPARAPTKRRATTTRIQIY